MNKILFSFVLSFVLFGQSLKAQSPQSYSTEGKHFWMGFAENYLAEGDSLHTVIALSSRATTKAKIVVPKAGWIDSITIAAGTVAYMEIPKSLVSTKGSDKIGNAVFIEAEDSVMAYALNINPHSTDASPVFPLHTLQEDYFVLTYFETPPSQIETDVLNKPPLFRSEFVVVATQDSTMIEITPTVNTQNTTHLAGVPFTVTLNNSETYQLQAYGDLTGTRVRVVNNDGYIRPIAVFAGNGCTNVGNCGACDHLYEQVPPRTAWGKKFGLMGAKGKISDVYRVLATEDNTTVIMDTTTYMLDKGQYAEKTIKTSFNLKASFITADKPILTARITRGAQCDGMSSNDPDLIFIPPLEKTVFNSQTVFVPVLNGFTGSMDLWTHYVNIMTTATNKSSVKVKINNQTISLSTLFKPIPQDNSYVWAAFNTSTEGLYTITADSGFTTDVYGLSGYDSYGYSGSVAFLEAPPLYARLANVKDASALGATDGEVTLDILSGTPPFKLDFSWGAPQTETSDLHPIISNAPQGTFTITITDAATQKTSAFPRKTFVTGFIGPIGRDELLKAETFQNARIYPNPFGNALSVSFSLSRPENVSLALYDARGTAVLHKDLGRIQKFDETLNLDELPSGIYLLTLNSESGVRTERVFKK